MRVLLALILFGLFSVAMAANRPQSASPKMTAEERAKIIKSLNDSRKELFDAIEGLSDAQWNYKPSPFTWSVGEVVEHIAVTEDLLFGTVERALAARPDPDWETKTKDKSELLERVLPNRTGRAQAPEMIRPRGKMTRAEVIARFKEVRARTIKFAEQTDLPLKAHTLDHQFRIFSTLNAYQWLSYIPLHHIRHNKQLAEVKASAGFPK
ncbi:MAG TPA: DinB family protein [Blastocatellia bacterium]|nr:DinB family protein [Blastocatellia bacterium]